MTTKQEAARDYAERIITGEYKYLALVLVTQEDDIETFYDGSRMAAVGMFEYGKLQALNPEDNQISDDENT